jgi:4-hydroxybenzoate polyprenyltransferase
VRGIVVGSALIGLVLAAPGGLALLLIGVVGLSIGGWYDLRAKGTTLSWLPFAIGIPLLPVFGWYGAVGSLPGVFLVLVPAAANAGTALAIANAVVDMERDEAAGIESIALSLGARRSGWLIVGLQGVVAALALGTAAVVGAPAGWAAAVLITACVPLAGGVLGLVAIYRGGGPGWRELAWEIQAVGVGLLAVAWLGALSAASGGTLPA